MNWHILSQITQIYADKRQIGLVREMDLLKQMPQIAQRKTVETQREYIKFVVCLRRSA